MNAKIDGYVLTRIYAVPQRFPSESMGSPFEILHAVHAEGPSEGGDGFIRRTLLKGHDGFPVMGAIKRADRTQERKEAKGGRGGGDLEPPVPPAPQFPPGGCWMKFLCRDKGCPWLRL